MGIYDRDWYWQDRARKERQYYNPREFRSQGAAARGNFWPRRVFSIRFHILLASVFGLSCLLAMGVAHWRAEAAAERLLRSRQEAAARAQAAAAQAQQEVAARQANREAELRRQDALRTQAIIERWRAEDEQLRAHKAEAERKDRAWAKFYRRSPVCEAAATIECANDYIRAKRAFEERYARNQL
jgi:hypothetical protein